jgi:cytoskeletal protein CcmA (bactofilin family)
MNQFESGGSNGGQTSFIDPNTSLEGVLNTDQDLRVEGSITGTIICDGVLTVAEGATVDAEIDASSIVVAGHMSGTIRCRGRLEIRSTGNVSGDVSTGALVILEGASYEGRIEMEATAAEPTEHDLPEQAVEEDESSDEDDNEYSFLRRFAPDDDDEDAEDEA